MATHLCGDVSILLSITIHVVGIYVVRPRHAIHWLQKDPRMIVRDNISVTVLRFVVFQVGVVPCELLPRLDAFIFLRELVVIMITKRLYMTRQLSDWNRWVILHACNGGNYTRSLLQFRNNNWSHSGSVF